MSVIIVTVSVLLTTFAITESGKTNVGKIVFPESPETLKKETQVSVAKLTKVFFKK